MKWEQQGRRWWSEPDWRIELLSAPLHPHRLRGSLTLSFFSLQCCWKKHEGQSSPSNPSLFLFHPISPRPRHPPLSPFFAPSGCRDDNRSLNAPLVLPLPYFHWISSAFVSPLSTPAKTCIDFKILPSLFLSLTLMQWLTADKALGRFQAENIYLAHKLNSSRSPARALHAITLHYIILQ